ncbi:MAG TPA: hypothetical protein VFN67_18905, partial [Polyangiales bacterium]|nr:hypothetical protein [Polyangiales bacterium]
MRPKPQVFLLSLPVRPTRLVFALLGAVLSNCTPVAAVNRDGMSGKQDGSAGEGGSPAVTSTGSVEQEKASRVPTANASDACDETGKRVCSKSDLRMPLLCQDGQWRAQTVCGDAERCETTEGGQLGTCVAIASECLSHEPGDTFCDGDFLRSCDDLVLTKPRKCEERRRCMVVSGSAQCVCAPGWIDDGSGAGCQVPTSCMTNNGGCDPLSQCSSSGSQRVCSMCPPGFEGSGDNGCYAQLSKLELDTGTLTPAFAPDVHSYRITLPLLRSSVHVTTQANEGVKVAFDSVDQKAGSAWQSPLLPFGEHKFVVSLSTGIGLTSTYELLIERAGAQEAYLKAAHPDSDDEFGSSVALWGDTLAVGVYAEDSSGTRDQVDNSSEGSGAVYIFVRNGGRWEQQDYVKASTPVSGDFFGYSVMLREDLLV